MKKQNKYHNCWWHETDGIRVIKKFPLNIDPNTIHDNVHVWYRGHGPLNLTRLEHYRELMKEWRGVPKTESHKTAMSVAATGVPKSTSHRASMSAAHTVRIQRVRLLQQQQPHLSYREAVILEARLRKESKHEE